MEIVCNVEMGQIVISNQDECTCNGTNSSLSDSQLVITGKSSLFSARIDDSHIVIGFSGIDINTTAPIMISSSSVTIVFSDSNRLSSSSPIHAGLECSSGSNLSIVSVRTGSLSAVGGQDSSGIGTGANGTCNMILIVNGSLSASGGTGIGSGSGTLKSSSQVEDVIIESGEINTTSLYGSGSGLGSGHGYYGNSNVLNLTIMNGNITSSS
jgi:hypothetical protein